MLLLRTIAGSQSHEHNYIDLGDLAKTVFQGQSITLGFVRDRVSELLDQGYVEAVNSDAGLLAARLTSKGRKVIREHIETEFAEPDGT